MSEPASRPAPQPQTPAPEPSAPGLAELFEQSLTAVVDPSVFRRAAARPAPAFGAAAGLALASAVAALAVGLAYGLVSSPGVLRQVSPFVLAAVAIAGLGLYTSLLLLLAVALYGIGGALGGKGEFERGLQAAAMISVLAPVQMLCGWFPAAWAAPGLLAAWLAAGALEGFFHANRGPARALCALLAAGALGVQFAGRLFLDRTRDAYSATQAMTQASAANADLARSMSAFAQQATAAAADAGPPPSVTAPRATSGLDLLRGPSEDDSSPAAAAPALRAPAPGSPPDAAPQAGITPEAASAAQAMQSSAAGMLDALAPMLDMLTASKTLRPEQKADIKELQGLMQDLKTHMASGTKMDNAVFAEKMSRYQALLMRVMAYSAQAQPAASGAPAPNAKGRLQLPKENR